MKTMFRLFFLGMVFLFPQAAEAQLLSVSGVVRHYISGQPIENATIFEANSGIGTITNSDGAYKLLLQKGDQNLKISSPGLVDFTATFTMAKDTVVSIDLKPRDFVEKNVIAGNKLDKDSTSEVERSVSTRKRK